MGELTIGVSSYWGSWTITSSRSIGRGMSWLISYIMR